MDEHSKDSENISFSTAFGPRISRMPATELVNDEPESLPIGETPEHLSGRFMVIKGIIFANASTEHLLGSLYANLHRMGITNTVVSNYNINTKLSRVFHINSKDMVLVNAPSTRTGLISEFGSIKMSINEEADIQRFGVLQKIVEGVHMSDYVDQLKDDIASLYGLAELVKLIKAFEKLRSTYIRRIL
ncbi:NOL1/NOP2/sun family protein [Arabidopsis thaliana]|uniref:NOL1/NOP2/sun family protein n=1 Tax=Arabidopsis thaliana TaxID=3702 RepID=F4JP83_ARATH|nr:NOL1/NOP2/sun family protein [Arabidopsis thaliana]AEE83918.1 NOL1/NOP2/sun family protein [Arabidopsis thaliana]|eukprot:NP_001154249.1 NOL1/NOP2/sun family protein [Arabidopsis thaliana]